MAMAKFIFDGPNKLFIARSGVTTFDVQIDLYSDWKEELLLSDNMKFLPALRTVGGDPLTAGRTLGDSYFLTNGWRIRPYEAEHRLLIDGNLFTEEGDSVVVPTTGDFNVLVEMFVSNLVDSTVSQIEISNLQFLIESQRSTHKAFGSIAYVDPINGNDVVNNGTSKEEAYLTIQHAIDTASPGNGDIVFVFNDSSGPITVTENINLNQADLMIRGPGGSIILAPADESEPTVTFNARNCQLDGFTITGPTGNNDAVCINADQSLLNNFLITNATMSAINVKDGDYIHIQNGLIDFNGQYGINLSAVSGSLNTPIIERVVVDHTPIGINIESGVHGATLLECNIHNAGTGIFINSGVHHTFIQNDCFLKLNTVELRDDGTFTENKLDDEPIKMVQKLKESDWLHSSAPTGERNFEDMMTEILSMAKGRIVQTSSGVFDMYAEDDATVLYTFSISGNERTPL